MADRNRRGAPPSVTIYNASDDVQSVLYDSWVYSFEPGKEKQIEGQTDVLRDEFGRPTEEAMAKGLTAPKKGATAEDIANHVVLKGKKKGLCRLYGDNTDEAEIKKVRQEWIKARTLDAKAIESRWRQKCLESKAAGAGIPPMPEHVERAQDFLVKYKNGMVEVHKRFVVTVDGRSFDSKEKARRHIVSRYPSEIGAWETLVNDTQAAEGEANADQEKALDALSQLAAVATSKKDKE